MKSDRLRQWTRLNQGLLAIGIFTLPFQIDLLIGQASSAGYFNPYLSEIITLSQVLLALFCLSESLKKILTRDAFTSHTKKVYGAMLLLLSLSLIISNDLMSSLVGSGKYLLAASTLALIIHDKTYKEVILKAFLATTCVQIGIGSLQVINQGAIGLQLLGEQSFDLSTSGIAKTKWGDQTWLRAQGTLQHANILAGYALMSLLTCLFSFKLHHSAYQKALSIILVIGILITGSEAAFLALIGGLAWIQWGNTPKRKRYILSAGALVVIGLILLKWNSDSIQERLLFTQASLQLIGQAPWGVGIDQFTAIAPTVLDTKLQPWQQQPVHNIFLLFINEWGLQTFLSLIYGFKKTLFTLSQTQQGILFSGIIIGSFDHYLFSLPSGLGATLALIILLMLRPKNQGNRAKSQT